MALLEVAVRVSSASFIFPMEWSVLHARGALMHYDKSINYLIENLSFIGGGIVRPTVKGL
jgi:hypothetical protein